MKKYRHKNTISSFMAAQRGLMLAIKSQRNFRVGFLIALIVLAAGILLKFSFVKMAVVVLAIGFVLFAELINTAVEFVVDTYFKRKYSEMAKMTKDIAAGAVLLAIYISALVGVLLFLPGIIKYLQYFLPA